MTRITRSTSAVLKREEAKGVSPVARDEELPKESPRRGKRASTETTPKVMLEDGTPLPTKAKTQPDLQAKKLRAYAQFANSSPFPDFQHPTPEECTRAHSILASLHGTRTRPAAGVVLTAPTTRAGCGDAPSVLDALVRTILSQNTSDTNSARAKRSMDAVYGRSDNWPAIVDGGQQKLQQAIRCGGLSVTKSRVIVRILQQVHARYGAYSLDHLHAASSANAMRELLQFQGVGPKTASCVLLFCLRRDSFAVDTHVYRITGLLGWRPAKATRDETHQHLEARIPAADKYGLHVLLVAHGKRCAECRAGGVSRGKCALRRAFRDQQEEKVKVEAVAQ